MTTSRQASITNTISFAGCKPAAELKIAAQNTQYRSAAAAAAATNTFSF